MRKSIILLFICIYNISSSQISIDNNNKLDTLHFAKFAYDFYIDLENNIYFIKYPEGIYKFSNDSLIFYLKVPIRKNLERIFINQENIVLEYTPQHDFRVSELYKINIKNHKSDLISFTYKFIYDFIDFDNFMIIDDKKKCFSKFNLNDLSESILFYTSESNQIFWNQSYIYTYYISNKISNGIDKIFLKKYNWKGKLINSFEINDKLEHILYIFNDRYISDERNFIYMKTFDGLIINKWKLLVRNEFGSFSYNNYQALLTKENKLLIYGWLCSDLKTRQFYFVRQIIDLNDIMDKMYNPCNLKYINN